MTTARNLIVLCLVAGAALWACGEADWMGMNCPDEANKVRVSTITYQWTDDPKAVCHKLGGETLDRGGACIQCSEFGDSTFCTMYANKPSEAADRILGHEVKHAFGCKHA